MTEEVGERGEHCPGHLLRSPPPQSSSLGHVGPLLISPGVACAASTAPAPAQKVPETRAPTHMAGQLSVTPGESSQPVPSLRMRRGDPCPEPQGLSCRGKAGPLPRRGLSRSQCQVQESPQNRHHDSGTVSSNDLGLTEQPERLRSLNFQALSGGFPRGGGLTS